MDKDIKYDQASVIVSQIKKGLVSMSESEREAYFKKLGFVFEENNSKKSIGR